MVYKTRRTRIRHKKKWKRWRKWTPKRYWRHRHYRRRWHRRPRRTRPVRQPQPRPQKTLRIYGWEPLGYCGTVVTRVETGEFKVSHAIKSNNEVTGLSDLLQSDNKNRCATGTNTTETFKKFAGGYGTASFSLKTLYDRANKGLCEFSEDMTDYTHIKWVDFTAYLVPTKTISWLCYFETHFTNNQADYKNKMKWAHPFHLLMKRGAKLVQSLDRYNRGKWKKIKKKPSPELCYRWYDKETIYTFLLVSYVWSVIDLKNPFGPPGGDIITDLSAQMYWKNEWMSAKGPEYYDRKTYDKEFLDADTSSNDWWKKWLRETIPNVYKTKKGRYSPFCPPMIEGDLEGFYFLYYFKFKMGGKAFDSAIPGDPTHEVKQLPKCFGPPDQSGTCNACIRPGDLDSSGFIKSKKFRSLVGADYQKQLGIPPRKKKKKRKKVRFEGDSEEDTHHKQRKLISHGNFFF